MPVVIGWLLSVLPLIWAFVSKALPKLIPSLISVAGRGGVLALIASVIVKIYSFIIGIPGWLIGVYGKGGLLFSIIMVVRIIIRHIAKFPVIVGFTLLMGQYFPTIFEKIFLVVGALSIKLALVFVGWGKSFIDGLQQNNTSELNQILGDSLTSLPPCMVDIMGYMHFVEDVGFIVTTAVFVGIYNLVWAFFMRMAKGF